MKKSLSSGKASGKWDNVPNWAKRRIAELEAEVIQAYRRLDSLRECPRCGWPLSLPFPPPTRKKERDDG